MNSTSGTVARWAGVASTPVGSALHQDILVASDPRSEFLVGMTVMRPGSSTETLSHTEDEFVYVTQGRLVAELNEVVHQLLEGSHVLLRSGTRHAFRNESTNAAVMLFVFPRGRGEGPAAAVGSALPQPFHHREGQQT